jgi:hypothetical protein
MPKLIPVKIASQKFELSATDNAFRFALLFNIVATAENMLTTFYVYIFLFDFINAHHRARDDKFLINNIQINIFLINIFFIYLLYFFRNLIDASILFSFCK